MTKILTFYTSWNNIDLSRICSWVFPIKKFSSGRQGDHPGSRHNYIYIVSFIYLGGPFL